MKYNVQNLAMLSAVIAFASCESKKTNVDETATDTIQQEVATDTIKGNIPESVTKTFEGKVLETNHGKDGYTAKIQTADSKVIFVTISHSNLKDAKQYRDAKIGEPVKVTGEYWKMGEEGHLTVRELQ